MVDFGKLSTCDALVLGGGISGITTAIVLQSCHVKVGIISDAFPTRDGVETGPPGIPTGYAMASAYPHNLRVDNLDRISSNSQSVFKVLSAEPHAGVSVYKIFEAYEECPSPAPLALSRMDFREFEGKPEQLKSTVNPPARAGAEYLWGWVFKSYFADMPFYVPYLWSLFHSRGGVSVAMDLSYERIFELAAGRPLVNCLGYGALSLFDDTAPYSMVRGKQVVVENTPFPRGSDGLPVAYNYTPVPEVFPRFDGDAEYIHFFPRKDTWILGQTREPGTLDENGEWSGEAVDCAGSKEIGGVSIPAPIVELNKQILSDWLGREMSGSRMHGREGFRYYRDPDGDGVRLCHETVEGVPVIHNYGHGGSGITMSWGCSVKVARILSSVSDLVPPVLQSKTPLDRVLHSMI